MLKEMIRRPKMLKKREPEPQDPPFVVTATDYNSSSVIGDQYETEREKENDEF
jgi:hypothetical protein